MSPILEEAFKAIIEDDKSIGGIVLFHHDKDGKLISTSPMLQVDNAEQLINKLLQYSKALKAQAEEMTQKLLPKN